MIEVVQTAWLCFRCKQSLHAGDEVETVSLPILFRYGKQRKKAKANTHHTHVRHVKCAGGCGVSGARGCE